MQASKVFEPLPAQVGQARRFAAETLRSWGVECDEVVLLVSELATNAVLHARSDFELTVVHHSGRIRVEVFDSNTRLPSYGVVPIDAGSGRGLLLLQALAGAWGVDTLVDGKTIWFEVTIPE